VAAKVRDDARVRVVSAQIGVLDGPNGMWEGDLADLSTASGMGWVSHVTGVLWNLAERGFESRGMDIAIDSCVPAGAGMGSSAALQCAVALAVSDCWELLLDSPEGRVELAEAAIGAETRHVGVPTGGLDQHCIMQCAPGEAALLDFATQPPAFTHQPLYFPNYGRCLLVIDTGTPHDLRSSEYAQRRQSCEQAAEALGAANLREVFENPYGLRQVNQLAGAPRGDRTASCPASHCRTQWNRTSA